MSQLISDRITSIKSEGYREKYGAVAKIAHAFSKRVLQLEGVVEPDNPITPTATDLMFAKCIVNDVKGGGWEGSGQAIMKMMSIMLGRNLQ